MTGPYLLRYIITDTPIPSSLPRVYYETTMKTCVVLQSYAAIFSDYLLLFLLYWPP